MERKIKRLRSLDLVRLLALLLMFASHSAKGVLEIGSLSSPLIFLAIKIILLLEPLSSAWFLFVSGYCLGLTVRTKSVFSSWRRGLTLIVLSQLLFRYHYRHFLPLWEASGILQLIGFGYLFIPFWKKANSPLFFGTLTTIIILLTPFTLRYSLGMVNTGAFPLLPHLAYFSGGLFWFQTLSRLDKNYSLFRGSLIIVLSLGLIFIFAAFPGTVFANRSVLNSYWQPGPFLVTFGLLSAFWLERFFSLPFFRPKNWSSITFFSRHSLTAYLAHLVFLKEISPYLKNTLLPDYLLVLLLAGCFVSSGLVTFVLRPSPAQQKASVGGH